MKGIGSEQSRVRTVEVRVAKCLRSERRSGKSKRPRAFVLWIHIVGRMGVAAEVTY